MGETYCGRLPVRTDIAGYSIFDDLKAQQVPVDEALTTRVNLLKLTHGGLRLSPPRMSRQIEF